jgi:hypothetical protein
MAKEQKEQKEPERVVGAVIIDDDHYKMTLAEAKRRTRGAKALRRENRLQEAEWVEGGLQCLDLIVRAYEEGYRPDATDQGCSAVAMDDARALEETLSTPHYGEEHLGEGSAPEAGPAGPSGGLVHEEA